MYETDFQKIDFDVTNAVLKQTWLSSTSKMTVDEYQVEQLKMLNLVKDNKAKALLANTKNFDFTIDPDMQLWTSETINEGMFKAGIKKVAFIVTSDIFSQVSIEQTQDENPDDCFELQYFEDAEEGFNWLIGN